MVGRIYPGERLLFISVKGSFLFTGLVLACIASFDLYSGNCFPYLWRYVAHGIFGVMVGVVFNKFVLNHTFSVYYKSISATFVAIFIIIEVLVALVPGLYSFFLYKLLPSLLAVGSYFVGMSLALYVVYDFGKKRLSKLGGWIVTVGQSTLLVYLLQIVLIDVVVLFFMDFNIESQWGVAVMSASIFLVCLVACWIVKWGRQFTLINIIYKSILL